MILQIGDSSYYLEREYQDIVHDGILLNVGRSSEGGYRLRGRRHPIVLAGGEEYGEINLEDGLSFSIAAIPCRCYHEETGKPIPLKKTVALPRGTTLEEDRTLIEELKKLRR